MNGRSLIQESGTLRLLLRSFEFKQGVQSVFAVVTCLWLIMCGSASGQGTIRYETNNLADVVLGEDLWEYSFFLSGFNFQTNQGFSVFLDHTRYAKLAHPNQSSLDPLWDLLVVQPDLSLAADGFLDALAKGNSPSLAIPFRLQFVWLGGTEIPGDVPFYTYDLNGPNFQILAGGMTSLAPEPQVWAFLGLGGLAWLVRRKRTSHLR